MNHRDDLPRRARVLSPGSPAPRLTRYETGAVRRRFPAVVRLDVSFGWRERAASDRRRRGQRWQRLVVAVLLTLAAAAVLWQVTRAAPWPG